MKIPSKVSNFIKDNLLTNDVYNLWMMILKTHVKYYSKLNNKEDFSFHKDFSTVDYLEFDVLEGMSLAEISMVYEYTLALNDKAHKKITGSYYTPEDIAVFMAKHYSIFEKDKVWLDPCSGVGNLSYYLALVQDNPEDFVLNNLILQDINELALKIAHTLFALYFSNTIENYYDKIAKNFIVKDFLKDYVKPDQNNSVNVENSLFDEILFNEKENKIQQNSKSKKYDYVIVNPPYLSKTKNDNFITVECSDLYAYFLEKIAFESEGFISITPQSFTNGKKFQVLRNILINEINDLSIYSCDNMPDSIFKSYKYESSNTNTKNSVRASIIVAQKSDTEQRNHKITFLMRWTSSQRQDAIDKFDEQLVNTVFEIDEIFPKLYSGTENFYNEIKDNDTIESLLSKTETKYWLIVPSTPRYYISASKTDLSRSSFHKLFFNDEESMNLAYVLINSSYMYWWWRVVSDGMSLSKDNLTSLPLIKDLDMSDEKFVNLVEKLENSEKSNKVVKLNAGKENENIKHPFELVSLVNKEIVVDSILINNIVRSHRNSIVD